MLIQIIMTLIIVGLLLYLVNFLPLDATIKKLIHTVAIVIVILWLISRFLPMLGLNLP